MKSPFLYGKSRLLKTFINRKDDKTNLIQYLKNGINITLISPRRWGKTALIDKVAKDVNAEKGEYIVVKLDLFNVSSEEEFKQQYITEVLKATNTKTTEWFGAIKKFAGGLVPKISFKPDPFTELSLSINWDENQTELKEVLQFPEKVAKAKKKKIIICIDEFQNIEILDNSLAFQKKLRATWQQLTEVTFCLYGSKRHMMTEFFTSTSMPFYKFGELIYLQKIEPHYWVKFIVSAFKKTKRSISKQLASELVSRVVSHSYFVQQYAHHVWSITQGAATIKHLEEALDTIIEHNAILYFRLIEELSSSQINLLKAICDGHKKLSSAKVIKGYRLNSSANVAQAKKYLIHKDILDDFEPEIQFVDPVFRLWFIKVYMKKPLNFISE